MAPISTRCDFGEATLTFPQAIVLRYGRFEPEERRLPQAVTDYRRWFFARLRAVEATLEDQDFIACERFTMADISVGYALMLAHQVGQYRRDRPADARLLAAAAEPRRFQARLRRAGTRRRGTQAPASGEHRRPAPVCANLKHNHASADHSNITPEPIPAPLYLLHIEF